MLDKTKKKLDFFNQENTFIIKILYQQNFSYQGEIQWLEKKETRHFRSLLELIMLIQEAFKINSNTCINKKNNIRKWKNK
ncbi:MAG: hypothetical protein ACOCQS_00805 [Bacillota bacterium]